MAVVPHPRHPGPLGRDAVHRRIPDVLHADRGRAGHAAARHLARAAHDTADLGSRPRRPRLRDRALRRASRRHVGCRSRGRHRVAHARGHRHVHPHPLRMRVGRRPRGADDAALHRQAGVHRGHRALFDARAVLVLRGRVQRHRVGARARRHRRPVHDFLRLARNHEGRAARGARPVRRLAAPPHAAEGQGGSVRAASSASN